MCLKWQRSDIAGKKTNNDGGCTTDKCRLNTLDAGHTLTLRFARPQFSYLFSLFVCSGNSDSEGVPAPWGFSTRIAWSLELIVSW